MANKLVENVYIIDTGSGNLSFPWNSGSRIQSISWLFSGSTGALSLSLSDTTNVIFRQAHPQANNQPQSGSAYLGGISISELKVPILTVGTAWIYLS